MQSRAITSLTSPPVSLLDWIAQDVFVIQGSSSTGIQFGLWAKKEGSVLELSQCTAHCGPVFLHKAQTAMEVMCVGVWTPARPPAPDAPPGLVVPCNCQPVNVQISHSCCPCQHGSEHLVEVLARTQKVTGK